MCAVVGLLYVKQGLLSTGLSKHLVQPYSDSGIRSTCHRDKSRPQARVNEVPRTASLRPRPRRPSPSPPRASSEGRCNELKADDVTPKQAREKRSEAEFGGGGRTFSEVNMVRLDLLFWGGL